MAVGRSGLLDKTVPAAAVEEKGEYSKDGERKKGEDNSNNNLWSLGFRRAGVWEDEGGDIGREGGEGGGSPTRRGRRGGVEWEEGRSNCGQREFGEWMRKRR